MELFHLVTHTATKLTFRKHVSKSQNMQKFMVKFLRKFENHGIKIAEVNSILINKSINLHLFTLILYGVGCPLCVDIFKLTASA